MEPTNGTERSGRRFSVQSLVAKLHRLRRPQPRGSRRERHGDPVSSDSLSTPHVLCSNCKSVFRHSQILQKALASHLTGKERNDEAAANSARHQEIDKSYKDQVHRVKLQLDLELSQEQVASGHDLDGRHAEKVQRISKILSTGRDITERFLHHPNLQSLESSIRRDKCHFCSIVKNVIHGPLTSNPKQDTQIWIKMSEWPSSVGIEVHVSREKHLSISDMFSQSNGERIWATKVTKSAITTSSDSLPSNRTYAPTTGSTSHLQLVHLWLRECLQKHPFCGSRGVAFSPTRLVEIQRPSASGGLSVKLSRNHQAEATYCTLSYRWGGLQSSVTLQSETLAKFEQGISFEKLPKTIQQAVEVTYALGQRYLWIDCLCIIQNSESDCALQSRQMCSIYEHAVCTIAAESARNIDQGLFKKQNPLTYMPCEILSDGLTSMVAKPHLVDPQSNERFSNLGKRGWCFQEQLYSHRMLVFGDFGLTWMCEQGQADEWKPEGEGIKPGAGEGVVNSNTKFEVRTIFGPKAQILDCEADLDRPGGLYEGRKEFLSFSKHQLGGATLSPQEAHRRWFGIVAPYSKTTLTYGSDKLVALAGLAARIQANTGFHYLAGIWQGCLPFDLLWTLTFSSTTKRPASYRAPTWSWASIDKEVESWVYWGYDVPAEAILCLLEGCDIQHSDSADVHNIGAVLSASLTLCGMLRYLRAELLSPSVDHEDNSWFTSSKNIHDSGGTFLGQFHPDTPSPDLSTVYLLPVMKSCRDPGFRSTRQLFPWMEDASSRKSDLRNSIMGLALTRLSTEGHHYERLGVFHFDYDSPEDLAATWFDDMEEQKIVIW